MKITSRRTLDQMDIAAELRASAECGQRNPEGIMSQIGTIGTKLLNTSRARRKVRMRKVMRLVPEVVRAAPDDKLPGHPGSCLPGFPQIRTCPIRASGSSS